MVAPVDDTSIDGWALSDDDDWAELRRSWLTHSVEIEDTCDQAAGEWISSVVGPTVRPDAAFMRPGSGLENSNRKHQHRTHMFPILDDVAHQRR